ncbi:uncharacterized protein LOC128554883 [Mercenaria mercenaria]|uniref:uncharacterized protein LOC128554883 n=1 Tax=Mercenaria mercenaria TaxID=6596 RepID=UPI00234F162B|nr:uncharacterized protein LOC128554883 [Mercenaria mercenaria]
MTILKMIKAYIADEQDEWDLYLGCLAGAYRCTPCKSTKLTPNLLSLGREIKLPADLLFGYAVNSTDVPSYCEYVKEIRAKVMHAYKIARQYLLSNARRSKILYDTNISYHNYNAGDVIWYLHESRKVGVTPKLKKKFDGPFVVKEKMSNVNFVIQMNREGQEKLVHHDKLKPYFGTNIPRWIQKISKNIKKQQSQKSVK